MAFFRFLVFMLEELILIPLPVLESRLDSWQGDVCFGIEQRPILAFDISMLPLAALNLAIRDRSACFELANSEMLRLSMGGGRMKGAGGVAQ